MVGLNMNGPNRDQVLKFMEEKDRIEREIQELTLVLETNNVGMQGPLVDGDGYPRSDIDVYRVRHARHRIICLQNDHKEIMKKIERGLHVIHSEFRDPQGASSSHDRQTIEPMETDSNSRIGNGYVINGDSIINGNHREEERLAVVVEGTNNLSVQERGFLKVNLVSSGSPAEDAGLCEEDVILEFGSLNAGNFTELTQVADIVRHSVGSRINIKIRRGRDILNVGLVPSTWAGRGLLGCNVVPV
ncbi:26S proteasome non-ATPase regulatory subunit 9 [Eumeta japonica]|uniref:26S proteasome non-ATPase regulatory subunit 9 n=1 Tax=Eumeta variegata TaxID=151549 RepID=A0A4C1U3P2_EUMVA|nr:26S proteasome non-ATPase regulatory subunit 9 [Eumeta japonica]